MWSLIDTIDSTAVVKPLIEYYGHDLEIIWVTKPNLLSLFQHDNRITPVSVKYTKIPLIFNIDKLKIISESLRNPYDAIINLEIGTKFNSMVRFTKSKIKVGMPYEYVAENITGEHRVKHQLRIIKSFYKDINETNAHPYLIGSKIDIYKKFNISEKYIVICPTNSKFRKKNYRGYRAWPLDNWKSLIKIILEKSNLTIVITGGNEEGDFINQLKPFNERVKNLCGKTDISDLYEIMKKSECVIANDSGSAHVAGVSSKKIIALHGPTDYTQTAPYSTKKNKIIIASLNLSCSPCYNTEEIKRCRDNICMKNLSPSTVFNYIIS